MSVFPARSPREFLQEGRTSMSPAAIIVVTLVLGSVSTGVALARYRPPLADRVRLFVWLAAASVPVFLTGVLLHNLVDAMLHVEEPVFFLVAVVVAPLMFVGGLLAAAGMGLYRFIRVHGRGAQ